MNPTVRNAQTCAALGQRKMAQGDRLGAIQLFQEALRLEPKDPNIHILLAWALPKEGRTAEAEEHLRAAIQLNPENPTPYGMLGFRLQERGQFEEAIEVFEKGIALSPKQAGSYFGITQAKKITERDRPWMEQMQALAAEPDLPLADRIFLQFALGKSFDDLGEYEAAITHFDEANRLTANSEPPGYRPFDQKGYKAFIDGVVQTFTKPFFESIENLGVSSSKPIFIVGMPRSGTTLVEQIVSSHPQVAGAGELLYWREKGRPIQREWTSGRSPVPADALVAKAYLKRLDSLAPNAERVTDKMPINFLFMGIIHALLPGAKFIHCRRHPVDTCLSIFMTRYVTPPEFATNRENIVFGYQQYQRLMRHWNSVLPAEALLDISYEEIVADREGEARKMVAFCGLDWDDACLHHEQNERTVMTPSLWQARQPIYKTSVERWRRYEPWLGAFRTLLNSD